jgi:hypothetical protein
MSWANYSMGLDLFELNKKDEAEKLRTQSESCIFDIKKVSNRIKDDFPMPWHIDYQKSEKGR